MKSNKDSDGLLFSAYKRSFSFHQVLSEFFLTEDVENEEETGRRGGRGKGE